MSTKETTFLHGVFSEDKVAPAPMPESACHIREIAEDKEKLRKYFISLRANFATGERISAGEKISCELRNLPCIKETSGIAAFYPMRFEPDIWHFVKSLLNSGVKIYLPRFNKEAMEYEMAECLSETSLVPGKFNIPEPPMSVETTDRNVLSNIPWLVPGIAFDRFGNRLGHGLGIFDRLLRQAGVCKIGICFDFQLAKHIPSDIRDVKMDIVVTEKRILYADIASADSNKKNKKHSEA